MFLLSIGPPGLDSSGYGEMQRRVLLALEKQGWKITLMSFDTSNVLIDDGINNNRIREMENRPLPPPKSPLLYFAPAPMFRARAEYYNIGYTMTEVDSINQVWVDKCNSMDEVWVPSRFNYETFLKCGVKQEKLSIMPLGVDIEHFRNLKRTAHNRIFTFFSSFELIPRKACDILLEAYCEEFRKEEPVKLLLKAFKNGGGFDPHGASLTRLLKKVKEKHPYSAPVILEKRVLSYNELPSLYQQSDCYVSSSRGEGWNIPAMEAMACAIPVIAYNWSGHTEFLNNRNSFLIPVSQLEFPRDGLYPGSRWAVVDKESLRKIMRYVVKHKVEAKNKGILAREEVEKKYSIDLIAANITAKIKKIKI